MKIKVVSINVYVGGRIWHSLVDFIKSEKPDILLLQEVFNGNNKSLPNHYRTYEEFKNLGFKSSAFEQAFVYEDENGLNPEGNAVFSKFEIISSEMFALNDAEFAVSYKDIPENWPVLPRIAQLCKVDVSGTEVNIVNVQGVWDLAGDNPSEARQQMISAILDKTNGLNNVIIAGDTNANINNPLLRRLEVAYKPVFGSELKSTFNMKRKTNPGYATAAVDLMFVSQDIKVITKEVPQVDISDHLPLVVELEITQ